MSNLISVNVKTMGSDNPVSITVDPSIDITEFKKEIGKVLDKDPEEMRLIFRGKSLKDGTKLSDYSIEDGFTIQLVKISKEKPNSNEEPPPPPPPQRPRIQARYVTSSNVNRNDICNDPNVRKSLAKSQETIAKMMLYASELQLALDSGNQEQANQALTQYTSFVNQSFSTLMMNTTQIAGENATVQQIQINGEAPANGMPGNQNNAQFTNQFPGINFENLFSSVTQMLGIQPNQPH